MRIIILVLAALSVALFVFVPISLEEERKSIHIEPERARILIVGDLLFDRTIRSRADAYGIEYPFSCIEDFLKEYDLVVANLEGPITTYPSVSQGTVPGDPGNTRFTFPPELVGVLHEYGIRVVTIGNNHIRDFGREGIRETREFLDAARIGYVGDPDDEESTSFLVEVAGVPITFVSYNQFFGSREDTISHIQNAKYGLVVVTPHWGNEYAFATELQKELAEVFVSTGADAVVGHHPHVIQEKAHIGNTPVYYSIGNFMFDQYWQEGTSTGLGVEFTISEGEIVEVKEHTFTLLRDGRTCLAEVE